MQMSSETIDAVARALRLSMRMPSDTTPGQRIAAARKLKSWSQTDLAREVGVTRAAVGLWEINKTSPTTANYQKIAARTGASYAYLTLGEGQMIGHSASARETSHIGQRLENIRRTLVPDLPSQIGRAAEWAEIITSGDLPAPEIVLAIHQATSLPMGYIAYGDVSGVPPETLGALLREALSNRSG